MRGIARATLVGRLTRDPELKTTSGGTSVCLLGVAVTSSYKDPSGQWTEGSNFFDVVAFGAQGENAAKYLAKGREVAVDGRLDYQSWEAQDGSRRTRVQIIAETVMFIGGGQQRASGQSPPRDAEGGVDFGDEDDIPF